MLYKCKGYKNVLLFIIKISVYLAVNIIFLLQDIPDTLDLQIKTSFSSSNIKISININSNIRTDINNRNMAIIHKSNTVMEAKRRLLKTCSHINTNSQDIIRHHSIMAADKIRICTINKIMLINDRIIQYWRVSNKCNILPRPIRWVPCPANRQDQGTS